jgi:hypothetical protein
MPPYSRELTAGGIPDANDPTKILARYMFAIIPVTIQKVDADGTVWGNSVQKDALIDTGATTTSVPPSLRNELDLFQSGFSEYRVGGQPGEETLEAVPLYWARITFDAARGWWRDIAVSDRGLPPEYDQLCQVLIGVDVLQAYRFTFDGPGERLYLDRD